MLLKLAVIVFVAEMVFSVYVDPTLHLCEKPKRGSKCMIMCHFTDNGSQPVKIYKDTKEVAACTNQNTCVLKDTAYTNHSTIEWHTHGNETAVHFEIDSLSIARDQGKWKCSYSTANSAESQLFVYSVPSSCHLMKMDATDKMNATMECHVDCAYPADKVNVQLLIDGKQTTEKISKTDRNASGCGSKEEKSRTFSWPVTFNSESVYTCECSVAEIDWKDSNTIGKLKGPLGLGTPVIIAIVIVIVVIIIAVVIAIVLVNKRRNAKGGLQLAKAEEGEKEEL